MQIHASCAARDGAGVLLLGPSGSGKSDLLLRLMDQGWRLVADDRVEIEDGVARPPPSLAGLLEVRGLGIVRLPYANRAKLALAVELAPDPACVPRLPSPARHKELGLPVVHVHPAAPSACNRILLALECALGRHPVIAGAFV